MDYRRLFETLLGLALAAAVCCAGGCIFGVETDQTRSPNGAGDTSEPDDGGSPDPDSGSDSGVDVGPQCGDTGDGSCDCNWQNDGDGVCGTARRDENGICQRPEEFESSETTCDELDNDCDGSTDEGCSCEFNEDPEGVCGDARLGEGGLGDCREPSAFEPVETSCDGRDNDCDGQTDAEEDRLECSCDSEDDGPRDCYTGRDGTKGTGICSGGTQDCVDSQWETCQGEQTPEDEGGGTNCDDQRDNDCDGVTDEGCRCNFDGNTDGVCTDQIRTEQGDCPEPEKYEEREDDCDDGFDNDCDGDVDCNDADCRSLLGCR